MTIYEALEEFKRERQKYLDQGDEQRAEAYANAIKSVKQVISEMEGRSDEL